LKETAVIGQMISEICLKRRSDYQILFPGKEQATLTLWIKLEKEERQTESNSSIWFR
jgi:hypothetical protein